MVRLAAEEAEASGKTIGEVAIITTITTTITITTEAEGQTEATAHQETEGATITATVPLATIPQAIATRAMVPGQVEGRHGEGEVSCSLPLIHQSTHALLMGKRDSRCTLRMVTQSPYVQN